MLYSSNFFGIKLLICATNAYQSNFFGQVLCLMQQDASNSNFIGVNAGLAAA
jgi:hypothetical protein